MYLLFILLPKSYFASFLIGSACSMFASPGALGIGYLTEGERGERGKKRRRNQTHTTSISTTENYMYHMYIYISIRYLQYDH